MRLGSKSCCGWSAIGRDCRGSAPLILAGRAARRGTVSKRHCSNSFFFYYYYYYIFFLFVGTQKWVTTGPIVAGQLERGKGYGQYILSAKIVKTVLKSRFHPILTISPNFNLISSIFEFYERFSTLSLYWLVKSYDFTSQIAILTTLLGSDVLHKIMNIKIFSIKYFIKKIINKNYFTVNLQI